MSILFESFSEWKAACRTSKVPLYAPVLAYEQAQHGMNEKDVWANVKETYSVMRDAVQTGLEKDMKSRSGMVDNGGKRVYHQAKPVLGKAFHHLVSYALSAKEVNACMGRVVAAPTAGASGIMPSVFYMLEEEHHIAERRLHEALLVSAGIGLIVERRASVSGAVGGCQAETGSAAAMAAGGIVYSLDGDVDKTFYAVAITLQCMLGLVCDPVAGLVEVPCIVRNASAAAIAYSSAQIALAGVSGVIPVDECVDAMGEVGQSMELRYKETAEGGLAATPTAKALAAKIHGPKKSNE